MVSYADAYDNAERSRSILRKPDDVIDAGDLFDLARFFASSSTKYNNNQQYIFSSFDLLHYHCFQVCICKPLLIQHCTMCQQHLVLVDPYQCFLSRPIKHLSTSCYRMPTPSMYIIFPTSPIGTLPPPTLCNSSSVTPSPTCTALPRRHIEVTLYIYSDAR